MNGSHNRDTQDLLSRIRQGLDHRGYHHEPRFGAVDDGGADDGGAALVDLARQLGTVFVPEGFDPEHPVLVTQPADTAPPSQPFDRPEGIGWHNDFSTFPERPSLTLIWIAQQDPRGANFGAWRAASVADVLEEIQRRSDGEEILRQLRNEDHAVGYKGSRPNFFCLLERPVPQAEENLRFYGRSLREGACSVHGSVPPEVEQVIEAVEGAADTVGTTLLATDHALLVVDNRKSLHDRMVQSTGARSLRRAVLCFVR